MIMDNAFIAIIYSFNIACAACLTLFYVLGIQQGTNITKCNPNFPHHKNFTKSYQKLGAIHLPILKQEKEERRKDYTAAQENKCRIGLRRLGFIFSFLAV